MLCENYGERKQYLLKKWKKPTYEGLYGLWMRLRDKVKDVKIKSYNSNINILERMNQKCWNCLEMWRERMRKDTKDGVGWSRCEGKFRCSWDSEAKNMRRDWIWSKISDVEVAGVGWVYDWLKKISLIHHLSRHLPTPRKETRRKFNWEERRKRKGMRHRGWHLVPRPGKLMHS